MHRRNMVIALSAAGLAAACGEAIDRANTSPLPDVTVLDADLTVLKTAFNAARDHVRLLFIVGPTCGPCLRGLMETNAALGPTLLSDHRLATFVVGVPTLGAQLEHARRAARLIQGSSVKFYWDPDGAVGTRVERTLAIPEYAWDVWLTYAPGPVWEGETPPPPAAWMHQLGGLQQGVRLDADALARDVRSRVEHIA